ncbi:hypothetical protein SmJEL517_g01618 [Synchytrium microbalum]|uniref:Tubulin-specific chaperone A n=1 Tax=Synchytrium microbalum TaxID=1806994 RepID=A0A507CF99_9FUNG|nr:uncharacterized protein SmJEL517_g01618 [Synchytrium microbalum]TPX36193.1 hypothetical protein SmJEL517_g01618 [Synchytrium microbalum]
MQKEVLDETHQMMPDNKRRLGKAYKELETMVADLVSAEPKLDGPEEILGARTILSDVTVA